MREIAESPGGSERRISASLRTSAFLPRSPRRAASAAHSAPDAPGARGTLRARDVSQVPLSTADVSGIRVNGGLEHWPSCGDSTVDESPFR